MNHRSTDPLDTLLGAAFERALAAESGVDLVAAVMTRIRRRQRLRLLVLGIAGIGASLIGVLGALPLVDPLVTVLNGLAAGQAGPPVLVALTVVSILGGWLMLDEQAA